MGIANYLRSTALCLALSGCSNGAVLAPALSENSAPVAMAQPTGLAIEFIDSPDYAFSSSDRIAIQNIAEAAVLDARQLLEGEPAHIELVIRAGTAVIPETGEGGVALAPGRIGWTVDPKRPGGTHAVASAYLRSTLFHEMHHLVRGWTIQGGSAGRRMIDAAVAEGLATAFERDAAGSNPPWANYPDDAGVWSEQLIGLPANASYGEWMFQHSDGRRWIGYRAGTYLADRAIAESGRSAAGLAATPTDEIIGLSGCKTATPSCPRSTSEAR